MSGKTYGYARVSSREQNLNRQIDALVRFGVPPECVFEEKASGKDFNRPVYIRLCSKMAPGDVLVVSSIDRLGRNYREILEEWRRLTVHKGLHIVVLDMPLLDTRDSKGLTNAVISDIVLQLLSYVAETERENNRKRQAEGIAAAHARGVKFGRPRIARPDLFDQVLCEYNRGSITRAEAAKNLGVCVSTFDRWRKN